MTRAGDTPVFTARTLSFLRSLKRHNDRAWFAAHRDEYLRDVQQPMLDLVERLAKELPRFAPDLVASPRVSLFRVYRDTRFSADKSPFKTEIGAVFPHRDLHRNACASLYVQVGPGGTLIAGGIYRPERAQLIAIRSHVADTYRRLRAIVQRPALRRDLGELQGDPLRRMPAGYAPDHPAADLLKFRQFLLMKEYAADYAASAAFFPEVVRLFRRMAPLVTYLNEPLLAAQRSRDPLDMRR